MKKEDIVLLSAGEGVSFKVLGMGHVDKVSPQEDGAAFFSYELHVPPGANAPLHIHDLDSECMYVLEGEIILFTPDGEVTAGPGSFCYMPAGGRHGFRNDGEVLVRALMVSSPGKAAFAFYRDLNARMGETMDPVILGESSQKHGLRVV